MVEMGKPDHEDSSSDNAVDLKAFPVAAIAESKLFARTGGKAFETDSLESFYKPIDEYEGAHRFDPKFEWEPKEERRVVRRVGRYFRRQLCVSCNLVDLVC